MFGCPRRFAWPYSPRSPLAFADTTHVEWPIECLRGWVNQRFTDRSYASECTNVMEDNSRPPSRSLSLLSLTSYNKKPNRRLYFPRFPSYRKSAILLPRLSILVLLAIYTDAMVTVRSGIQHGPLKEYFFRNDTLKALLPLEVNETTTRNPHAPLSPARKQKLLERIDTFKKNHPNRYQTQDMGSKNPIAEVVPLTLSPLSTTTRKPRRMTVLVPHTEPTTTAPRTKFDHTSLWPQHWITPALTSQVTRQPDLPRLQDGQLHLDGRILNKLFNQKLKV